jgi:RNA polymerase-binding transcription factor DksA
MRLARKFARATIRCQEKLEAKGWIKNPASSFKL